MRTLILGAAAGCALLTACSSSGSVRPQMANTAGAIRAAEELGATNIPEAALHLKLAQEAEGKATRLVNDGDEEQGRRLLERAQMDAELAIALIRENKTRVALDRSQADLAKLDSQLAPKASSGVSEGAKGGTP